MAVRTGAPFVGRDVALAELRAALDAARSGRGGLVLVTGEAGIGKTRLAEELCRDAERAGAAVAATGCWYDGGAPALWPWARLLDELGPQVGPTARRVTRAAAARLRHSSGAAAEDVSARYELYDEVLDACWRSASGTAVVLFLDDLHAADVATVQLLSAMAPALSRHPVLVVATIRPDPGPAAALVRETSSVERIELEGLDRAAVAALVAASAGDAPDELVDVVLARTGGHPFFVQELLRLLALRGEATAQVAATAVPATVREALLGRLARVQQRTADLLGAVSVLGRPFDAGLAAAVTGWDVGEVLAAAEEAVAARFLLADGTGWRFAHDLTRDAVADTLSAAGRRRAHLRAGEVLAARAPSGSGEVARHLLAALPLGDTRRAAEAAIAAAGADMDRLAYEDAAELLDVAVAVDVDDPALRADLLLGLGHARRAAGDAKAAGDAYAAVAATVPGDAARISAAALGCATRTTDLAVASRASDPPVVDLLERAAALLTESGEETPLRVRVLARLGAELYFSDTPARARSLADEAVVVGRRVGDPAALVAALASHHDAHTVGHAPLPQLLAGSIELERLAAASGDRWAILAARRARIQDLLVAGDLVAVDAEIHEFARVADRLRVPAYQWWPALWRAMRALLDGRHGDAEALAVAAYQLGAAPLPHVSFVNLSFQLFFLRREQGRLDELADSVLRFAEEQADIPAGSCALALCCAELDRTSDAAAVVDRLAAAGYDRLRDRNWPASWFQLALAAAAVGDPAPAAELLELGRPLAGQCVQVSLATVCLGSIDLGLAALAATAGDRDAADAWFREATASNARIGARSWLAETQARHAELLGPGSVEGRTLAGAALEAARAIGLPGVERRAAALVGPRPGGAHANVFRRSGDAWEVGFGGRPAVLRHTKGMEDLAVLLARPGEDVHVAELLGTAAAPLSGGDDVLDARARREIRRRLEELERDIGEADERHDLARAEAARDEREAILDLVRGATGLGGRARRLGDDVERARKTVGARVRNAIARIEADQPALGRHLSNSVRLGTWCAYRPERPVAWEL